MGYSDKTELETLRKKIADLYEYISSLPYYEYHLDEINIEKVEGTVQLGKLVLDEQDNSKGVHKIFVDKVNIKEVSGKGVVGVGVTEKKKGKKKKDKIPPEKAPEEIKKIYEKIKKHLNVNYVPLFFQEVATKKKVLEKVEEYINKHKEKILSEYDKLQNVIKKEDSNEMMILFSKQQVDAKLCQNLTDAKEAQLKTWILITMILQDLFEGYEKFQKFDIKLDSEQLEEQDPDKILKNIKNNFNLKSLPDPIKKLKDDPDFLELIYINLINKKQYPTLIPLLEEYNKESKSTDSKKELEKQLSTDEESVLFEKAKKYLDAIPKYLYIENIGIKICDKR